VIIANDGGEAPKLVTLFASKRPQNKMAKPINEPANPNSIVILIPFII
jgi:hypothetical protein